jgi:3D (Asp-Asp-Asp) domain-containing protein
LTRAFAALALLAATTLPVYAQDAPLYGDEALEEEEVTFPLETPTPVIVQGRVLQATVTGYCLRGTMRSGRTVYAGAVATDPRVIPLGSRLHIEGLGGNYTAEDTGGGVHGAHVDVWFPSCSAAIQWGRQTRTVTVLP